MITMDLTVHGKAETKPVVIRLQSVDVPLKMPEVRLAHIIIRTKEVHSYTIQELRLQDVHLKMLEMLHQVPTRFV